MNEATQDVLNRAARLSQLEEAASLLAAPTPRGLDSRAWLGAALAVLLALYPSVSAAGAGLL